MGFFELPPPEPKRRRRRRRRKLEDDAWSPPSIYLPRYLQRDFVLASNDEVAVVVQGIACYPNGFAFELRTVSRFEPDEDDESARYGLLGAGRPRGGGEVAPEQLRFGLLFSNGSKGTTLDLWNGWPSEEDQGVRLHQGSGGGSDGDQYSSLWVTPLPPEGPVEFVCEWPAFGIDETRRRIDGSHFIKAAEKSKPIF